jgi:BirA family biotin operon repressor/biotin-[acetyl-CoA-carboxylase] ligase
LIGATRFDFEAIPSTNDAARAAVGQGAADGAIFVAAHQTAGRGRRGARWNAAPGESVLMTAVVYPDGPLSTAWRLGWVASVAIIEVLLGYGVSAACKWPNDIVVGDRKIAGILIETVTVSPDKYAALIGIGINVAQSEFNDAVVYRLPPTSLTMEIGDRHPGVGHVVSDLCIALDNLYRPDWSNLEQVTAAYNQSVILGREQSGMDPSTGEHLTGILTSIRPEDGAGLLQIYKSGYRYVIPDASARL